VATCELAEVEPAGGPWRPSFHALLLATRGHGTVEVDFTAQTCRPDTTGSKWRSRVLKSLYGTVFR